MILLPLVVFGVATGLAATMQNLRHSPTERRQPVWLTPLAATLAGVVIGGLLLGAVPRPAQTQGISPAVLATLPVLQASGFAFSQQEIQVRAGDTVALPLDNSDATTHTFTVDEFGVDVAIVPGQSSAAIFQPTQPGTYVYYCVPHYDRATGQGMHGTLVVE